MIILLDVFRQLASLTREAVGAGVIMPSALNGGGGDEAKAH
jgi:hypothetical protein